MLGGWTFPYFHTGAQPAYLPPHHVHNGPFLPLRVGVGSIQSLSAPLLQKAAKYQNISAVVAVARSSSSPSCDHLLAPSKSPGQTWLLIICSTCAAVYYMTTSMASGFLPAHPPQTFALFEFHILPQWKAQGWAKNKGPELREFSSKLRQTQ